MATIPKLAALLLAGALAGCAASSSSGGTSSSSAPAARVGLGAASPGVASSVSVVDDANFQTPSTNITCALTTGSVRCDIVHKNWTPPSKPSSCQLAWGNGLYLKAGKADFICAGDTVVGTAAMILPYGSSVRAGNVQCDSEYSALRCVDQTTRHGFTLAIEDYSLF